MTTRNNFKIEYKKKTQMNGLGFESNALKRKIRRNKVMPSLYRCMFLYAIAFSHFSPKHGDFIMIRLESPIFIVEYFLFQSEGPIMQMMSLNISTLSQNDFIVNKCLYIVISLDIVNSIFCVEGVNNV